MGRRGTATISNQWLGLFKQAAVLEMVAVPVLAKNPGGGDSGNRHPAAFCREPPLWAV